MKQDMTEVIRYSVLAYAGMCLRKYAMESLDDYTKAEHTHPLGCCNGCNVRIHCAKFIEDYDNPSVVNVLIACNEIENTTVIDRSNRNNRKIHANSNRIVAYLKGNKPKFNDPDFEVSSVEHTKFGTEKKESSDKELKIMIKQCIAKGWLKPDLYSYRQNVPGRVPRQINVLGLILTESGQEAIISKVIDLPKASQVAKALDHVRNAEEKFINPAKNNTLQNQTMNKPSGTKYKHAQPQVENMLLLPPEEIISKDQYQLLGFYHECNRLLYAENPENIPGYPGDGNFDFMFDDLNLSRAQSNPPIKKSVMVLSQNGVMENTDLLFTKNSCAGVKKCTRCDFVCSNKYRTNNCPQHGNKYPTLTLL